MNSFRNKGNKRLYTHRKIAKYLEQKFLVSMVKHYFHLMVRVIIRIQLKITDPEAYFIFWVMRFRFRICFLFNSHFKVKKSSNLLFQGEIQNQWKISFRNTIFLQYQKCAPTFRSLVKTSMLNDILVLNEFGLFSCLINLAILAS